MKYTFRLNRQELSGALGDVGIFIPLALSLIALNGLNPFSVFFMGGLLYLCAGYWFGHPLPVQPLKALAATALATGAGAETISAAAVIMGGLLFLFTTSRVSHFCTRIFTRPVIRGIQFGLGLLLIQKGAEFVNSKEYLFGGPEVLVHIFASTLPLGIVVGVGAVLFALVFYNSQNIPVSLTILSFGVLSGIIVSGENSGAPALSPAGFPDIAFPPLVEFLPALFLLVIPQIPLTIGNSLFATSATARDYFGKEAESTTPGALSLSLAFGNALIGLTGGMPLCHGAGGLTAHYRFGARTWGSNMIIGALFLLTALLSLFYSLSFLYLIPVSVLGALLIFTGFEHAMLIRDVVKKRNDLVVVLATGSMAMLTGSLFSGVVTGLLVKGWFDLRPLNGYEI